MEFNPKKQSSQITFYKYKNYSYAKLWAGQLLRYDKMIAKLNEGYIKGNGG